MLSIKEKILLSNLIVFGLMLLIFAFITYQNIKKSEIEKLDANLQVYASKIQTELEDTFDIEESGDTADFIGFNYNIFPKTKTRIIERSGKVILQDSTLATLLNKNSLNKALLGQGTKRIITLNQKHYRYLLIPIEIDDHIKYIVQLAASMNVVEVTLKHFIILFLISIPMAMLLTALASFLITRTAFRPMSQMVKTAQQISALNLNERVVLPKTRNEVWYLGEALNNMMDRIEKAFRSQRQFIANASHEIRTPLTIIYSELEYAKRYIKDQAPKESIDTSLMEIDYLTQMADELLLLAKIDASQLVLDMKPMRFDELVVDCIKLIESLAIKKNIEIKLYIEKAVELQGDKQQLKTVILNLLDNAVKYSPSHSKISVSLSVSNLQPKTARLTIKDSGSGISETELPHIFNRFYRARVVRGGKASGNGLGLAITKQLVELHKGKISVTNKIGKGTSFVVELPLNS